MVVVNYLIHDTLYLSIRRNTRDLSRVIDAVHPFVEQKYSDAHKTRYHPEDSFGVSKRFCLQCEAQFDTYGELEYHINETHNKRTKFELVETAYKLKHQDWRMMLGKFYSVIILQKMWHKRLHLVSI